MIVVAMDLGSGVNRHGLGAADGQTAEGALLIEDERRAVAGPVWRLKVARGCAQRRHSKHIRDEAELTAIPGEDHGAGAGEALRFLILDGFVDGLLRLVRKSTRLNSSHLGI